MNKNKSLVYFITLIVFLFSHSIQSEIKEENNVIILDKNNFDEVLQSNPIIMVEFYAPWCGICKDFAPKYEQVASKVKEQNIPIKIAKIDGDANPEVLQYAIPVTSYPTVLVFYEGIYFEYYRAYETEEVLTFIDKVLNHPYITYTTTEDVLKSFAENTRVMLSTFTEGHYALKEFKKSALMNELVTWVHCPSDECVKMFEPHYMVLSIGGKKDYINYPVTSEKISYETINSFIDNSGVDVDIPLDDFTTVTILKALKPVIIYFSKEEANESERQMLSKINKMYRKRFYFIRIATQGGSKTEQTFTEFFQITKQTQLPRLQLVFFAGETPSQYETYVMHTNEPFSVDSIETFIIKYMKGQIPRELKSEPLPSEEDISSHDYKRIVGQTFETEIIKSNKHCIVLFVDDECGEDDKCLKVVKIWEELSKKYKDDNDVLFGFFNMDHNELKDFEYPSSPSIVAFVNGKKDKPANYEGLFQSNDIEIWIADQIGWGKSSEL